MAPAHKDIAVDGHAPEAELHAAIKQCCRELLPGWGALGDAHIEISFISGGISNALFKVAPTAAAAAGGGGGNGSAALPPVAFRVYGDNTEQFVDRAKELVLMHLAHEHGFGPQVCVRGWRGRGHQRNHVKTLLLLPRAPTPTLPPCIAPLPAAAGHVQHGAH